jgi:hypothetical protein
VKIPFVNIFYCTIICAGAVFISEVRKFKKFELKSRRFTKLSRMLFTSHKDVSGWLINSEKLQKNEGFYAKTFVYFIFSLSVKYSFAEMNRLSLKRLKMNWIPF